MENIDNKKLSTGHFSVKGFQFSLVADAGAEYKVYKNVESMFNQVPHTTLNLPNWEPSI